MSEKALPEKHKAFIDEYFANGLNATQAYQTIYPKAKPESAQKQSSFLLKKLELTSYYTDLSNKKAESLQESFGIDRKWLIEKHKEVFESAMKGDYIQTEKGGYKRIDRAAANKALDQLCKMLGEYAEVKLKLQGTSEAGAISINVNFS